MNPKLFLKQVRCAYFTEALTRIDPVQDYFLRQLTCGLFVYPDEVSHG